VTNTKRDGHGRAAAGYKFTGWAGDVTGTSTSLQVNTSLPVYMIAEMKPVALRPTHRGEERRGDGTPPVAVAPGSLITIYGGALAPDTWRDRPARWRRRWMA